MKEIQGNKVLIAGFGKEGRSILRYLQINYPDTQVAVSDHNPDAVSDLDVKVFSGNNYLKDLESFNTVVRSPGISKNNPELQKAKHVTTATNIFFSESPGTTVGVTGTKGKSTTSSLIDNILKTAGHDSRLVGNIGNPALDNLKGSDSETIFVIELSSFQLDDCRYSPHIAVVLPLRREHIDYHGNFETYRGAKQNVVKHQNSDNTVIFNRKNTHSREIAITSKGTHTPFPGSSDTPCSAWTVDGEIWVSYHDDSSQVLMNTTDVPLLGIANIDNVLAAISVALSMKVNQKHIVEGVASFEPLEHRLEKVRTVNGVTYYNDSLATIPEATMHALEALGDKVETLITGGLDRDGEYDELGKTIANSSVKTLILFPSTGEKIRSSLHQANPKSEIEILKTDSMEEAVNFASDKTSPRSICLLSPASASFNLYKNYADRGNTFKLAVEAIAVEN